MLVESSVMGYWEFSFLTRTDDFGKVIAFLWRPFLPRFKLVLFCECFVFFLHNE